MPPFSSAVTGPTQAVGQNSMWQERATQGIRSGGGPFVDWSFLMTAPLLDSKISNKNATNSPQTFLILVTNDKVHAEEGSLSTSPPATLVLLVTAADLTALPPSTQRWGGIEPP